MLDVFHSWFNSVLKCYKQRCAFFPLRLRYKFVVLQQTVLTVSTMLYIFSLAVALFD
jgi:hypothetical protein